MFAWLWRVPVLIFFYFILHSVLLCETNQFLCPAFRSHIFFFVSCQQFVTCKESCSTFGGVVLQHWDKNQVSFLLWLPGCLQDYVVARSVVLNLLFCITQILSLLFDAVVTRFQQRAELSKSTGFLYILPTVTLKTSFNMQCVFVGFMLMCLLDQLFMWLALVCCYCGGMVCFLEGWNLFLYVF